jgi:hypothetical protein
MVRCLIGSGNGDSASWFLRRLSDRELSEQRRRTVGALLVSMAKQRASASLARDVWLAGRDLWPGLRKATTAVLACEAAAWLRDRSTFDDAFTVTKHLLSSSTRERLEFLREVYLDQPAIGTPRAIRLPVPLAHDGLLAYVDDYARARAADSEDRVEVALDYDQRALESLPRNHEAYEFALGRCNAIRNMRPA